MNDYSFIGKNKTYDLSVEQENDGSLPIIKLRKSPQKERLGTVEQSRAKSVIRGGKPVNLEKM